MTPRLSASVLAGLLGVSFCLWGAVASACLLVGSTGIGVPTAAQLAPRLEVVMLASLVGAALAAAGVVYQAVLRNPLADPYLLGVASGATLGSLLWRFPALTLLPWLAAAGQQAAALLGALAAVAVVFAAGARRGRLEPVTLLLTGVVVSSLCGAVLLLLVSLRPELLTSTGGGAASLLIGGLQTNLTLPLRLGAAAVVGVGFVVLMLLASPLSVAMLSDAEAESIGVRVDRLRWVALITASLVVAAAVAVSGPIAFVGLICPHLARRLVGPDPRRLLPVATALGAALLAAADALCRVLSQEGLLGTVLPVGVITSLLGGPFFLLLLLRQGRRSRSEAHA